MSETAITTTAPAPGEYRAISSYTPEEVRVYKRQLHCEGVSHDEWKMLEILSGFYRLDPFLRHIWAVPGIGVFVGHAGFLAIAHRSGRFGGMVTVSYNSDGSEYKGGGVPAYSTTKVSFTDTDKAVVKTVYWEEFGANRKGTNGKKTNWDKMPAYMLEKVAEVHALKRAFSISGIYCPEEMGYDEDEILPKPDYSATVDGEPVTVERMKDPEKKPEPQKPAADKCPGCGTGAPLIDLARSQYEKAFDEQGLGEIPAGLCKDCITKLWKERTEAAK